MPETFDEFAELSPFTKQRLNYQTALWEKEYVV